MQDLVPLSHRITPQCTHVERFSMQETLCVCVLKGVCGGGGGVNASACICVCVCVLKHARIEREWGVYFVFL